MLSVDQVLARLLEWWVLLKDWFLGLFNDVVHIEAWVSDYCDGVCWKPRMGRKFID